MIHATIRRALGCALAACIGLAAAAPAAAQGSEKLRVRLDWAPWGVHAPIHLAQQKGWFKAAGLDVRAEDGNGSVTAVQIVGGGDDFDLGHASLATMMIARDKGLPVKAVAVFCRLSDIGLLVPKGAGIHGPKDLKGRKVVYTAGSLEAPFVDAFLAAGGLTKGDVELVNVDAASKASTYATGRADAALSSVPFFLPVVSQSRPSAAIRFADYGLTLPSYGLFSTDEKLAQRRDAIARFASVVSAAWQYVFDGHEEEAVDAIIAQRPQAKLDRAVLRGQIDAMRSYFQSPAAAGQPIGVPVAADFASAVKSLAKAGLIKRDMDGNDYYAAVLVRPVQLQATASR